MTHVTVPRAFELEQLIFPTATLSFYLLNVCIAIGKTASSHNFHCSAASVQNSHFLQLLASGFHPRMTHSSWVPDRGTTFQRYGGSHFVGDRKEVYLQKLADLRRGSELTAQLCGQICAVAHNPMTEEALIGRVFVFEKVCAILDECFRLLHEKPARPTANDRATYAEELSQKLEQLPKSLSRHHLILAYVNGLVQSRIAEYLDAVAASQLARSHVNRIVTSKLLAVGMLLESCFAESFAAVERSRQRARASAKRRTTTSAAA